MFSKPHFLVIGPYRTGTTWLYSQLCHVDGLKMPPYKELNFLFDADMNRQWNDYKRTGKLRADLPDIEISTAVMEQAKNNMRVMREQSYRQAKEKAGWLWAGLYKHVPRNFNLFSLYLYTQLFPSGTNQITGDVSPAYFTLSPEAIESVKNNFPNVKVVMILRDPVEREWSNIRMHHLHSIQEGFSIDDYLKKSDLQRDYIHAINNWEKFLGREQMGYFFYDDLAANREDFFLQILNFIKPGLKVNKWLTEKVGESVINTISPELKTSLQNYYLPQHQQLAAKFGTRSWPAFWLQKAL